jgi:membrane associated rhomboid family serine protease
VIPLRDINRTTTRPFVTYVLIAVNLAVFAYQMSLGARGAQLFVFEHGFVPEQMSDGTLDAWVSPLTSMFMHGGLMHIASNMWFLHIFGDNVEDELGHVRYALFYVACGLFAVGAQYVIDPDSTIPMVGASGAIAGVLGAYYRFFPHARVVALIPIFILITVRELPAVLFLILWFVIQLLSGVGSLGASSAGGGVAYFAHVGGFVAGVALAFLYGSRRRRGWHVGQAPRRSHAARRWDA